MCSGRLARWRAASTKRCKPAGLTHGQFSLMISLNRPAPPSIGSVATLLAMDRTTVTANLKPLQRRGLVTLSVDANDRRSRRMALTRAGRRQLAAALPYWEAAQAETARLIARTRPDRLISLLRALS